MHICLLKLFTDKELKKYAFHLVHCTMYMYLRLSLQHCLLNGNFWKIAIFNNAKINQIKKKLCIRRHRLQKCGCLASQSFMQYRSNWLPWTLNQYTVHTKGQVTLGITFKIHGTSYISKTFSALSSWEFLPKIQGKWQELLLKIESFGSNTGYWFAPWYIHLKIEKENSLDSLYAKKMQTK